MSKSNNARRIRFANSEILGKGNLAVVARVFAASYILHSGGKKYKGHGFVRRFVKQLRDAIPDLRIVKIEILMQADDTIVWQRTVRGTHQADLKGIPWTGQRVKWSDLVVTRFKDGKIAEDWAVSDLAGHLLSKRRCA